MFGSGSLNTTRWLGTSLNSSSIIPFPFEAITDMTASSLGKLSSLVNELSGSSNSGPHVGFST
ncbi:hypothetical protein LINPERPRIM_LOCUS294 [Linum perenne]